MKTKFETHEELEILEKMYHATIMNTDRIYDFFQMHTMGTMKLDQYILLLLNIREKVHEYAGIEDMNSPINEQIKQKITNNENKS